MKFLSVFCIFLSLPAFAEYRVFKLQISSADGSQSREVLSTLDPDQYRGYYIVKDGETVSYTETWMCKGRTNELPLCPNPKEGFSDASVQEVPDIPPAPADSSAPPLPSSPPTTPAAVPTTP